MYKSKLSKGKYKGRKFDALIIVSSLFDIVLGLFSFAMPFLRLPAIVSTVITVILLIARVGQIRSGQRVITKISKQIIKEPRMKKLGRKIGGFFKFFFRSNPRTMCAISTASAAIAIVLSYSFVDMGWSLWQTIAVPTLCVVAIVFAGWAGFESNATVDARRKERCECKKNKVYIEQAKEILQKEKEAQAKQQADIENQRIQQIVCDLKGKEQCQAQQAQMQQQLDNTQFQAQQQIQQNQFNQHNQIDQQGYQGYQQHQYQSQQQNNQ